MARVSLAARARLDSLLRALHGAPVTPAYYVTIKRGSRTGYLVGPFLMMADAGAHIRPARDLAEKIDPWTHFDGFGITKVTPAADRPSPLPPGVLNERLGLNPQSSPLLQQ